MRFLFAMLGLTAILGATAGCCCDSPRGSCYLLPRTRGCYAREPVSELPVTIPPVVVEER